MLILPEPITTTITHLLTQSTARDWIASALNLSEKYRHRENPESGDDLYIQNPHDALGYLALRAPATYAQIHGALSQIQQLNPTWQPHSLLDLGSGPATATWAATQLFPSIIDITCLEQNQTFINLGNTILNNLFISNGNNRSPLERGQGCVDPIEANTKKVHWLHTNITNSLKLNSTYDLIILANVLNELTPQDRTRVLNAAYELCQGILLIVEPGTQAGHQITQQAATTLTSLGGHLIAPYIANTFISSPHHWIHFPQKYTRPEFQKRIRQHQRQATHKTLPPSDWEEAKYAYVAYSRFPSQIHPTARLIDKPNLLKYEIQLTLLTEKGIVTQKIPKRDKTNFKPAKKLRWGDTLP